MLAVYFISSFAIGWAIGMLVSSFKRVFLAA